MCVRTGLRATAPQQWAGRHSPSGTLLPVAAGRRELPSIDGGAECTSRLAGCFPLKQENIPISGPYARGPAAAKRTQHPPQSLSLPLSRAQRHPTPPTAHRRPPAEAPQHQSPRLPSRISSRSGTVKPAGWVVRGNSATPLPTMGIHALVVLRSAAYRSDSGAQSIY
eukprot:COSAG02_NODE_1308_length_13334_cov_5.973706_4_plen_167_part_00